MRPMSTGIVPSMFFDGTVTVTATSSPAPSRVDLFDGGRNVHDRSERRAFFAAAPRRTRTTAIKRTNAQCSMPNDGVGS